LLLLLLGDKLLVEFHGSFLHFLGRRWWQFSVDQSTMHRRCRRRGFCSYQGDICIDRDCCCCGRDARKGRHNGIIRHYDIVRNHATVPDNRSRTQGNVVANPTVASHGRCLQATLFSNHRMRTNCYRHIRWSFWLGDGGGVPLWQWCRGDGSALLHVTVPAGPNPTATAAGSPHGTVVHDAPSL